jgi:hypothetical protein
MSEELKACPLCGSQIVYSNGDGKISDISPTYWGVCSNKNCPLHIVPIHIENLQSRPIEDALRAENEQITKEAKVFFDAGMEYAAECDLLTDKLKLADEGLLIIQCNARADPINVAAETRAKIAALDVKETGINPNIGEEDVRKEKQ